MTEMKEEYEDSAKAAAKEHAAKAAARAVKAKQMAKALKRNGKMLQAYRVWRRRLRPKLVVVPKPE